MIIGVSRKAQKTSLVRFIKYIMAHYSAGYSWKPNEEDYKSWLKNGHQKHSHIEIKKYADKLKDIACIIKLLERIWKMKGNEPLGDVG